MKKLFLFMLSALSVCFVGCGGKAAAQKDTLVVCVEQDLGDDARNLLELWESMYDGVEGEVEMLSKDSDTREIQISNLRTELMAGEGPDVFLLSCGESVLPTLFNNPEKAMYTDTFLPLDTFLEQAEHISIKDWNQTVLKAGQTDEGQMILPLTYYYQKYTFDCFLEKLVDYENGKLLYSKEELENYAEEVCAYITSVEKMALDVDTSEVIQSTEEEEASFLTQLSDSKEDRTLVAFPTIEGGIAANVHVYAAINRNTSMQEEAFTFLELLCRDEILCGQSFQVEGEVKMCELPYVLRSQIINQNALAKRYPELSVENRESLETMDAQISTVRFYSEMEKEARDMFRLYFKSYWKNEDKSIRKDLLSKTYDTIEMKVLE